MARLGTGSLMQLPQCTPQSTGGAQSTPGIRPGGIGDMLGEDLSLEAVYLHVPFCRHRCHYCDFYTLAGREDGMEAYVDRAVDEMRISSHRFAKPVSSIFFGGGTPTLLPPPLLTKLMDGVREYIPLDEDLEWTVEANPETVNDEVAQVLAEHGATRISLGAQSFDPSLLANLERRHDPDSVGRGVECLRNAGIRHFNIDLIYAIPGQTMQSWETDLKEVVLMNVEHISCYGLVYEHGTPLTRRRDRGLVVPIEEELEAAMHCTARNVLGREGMTQYEISNWSRPGLQCRHNLVYWRNGNWWPIGPGACGHVDGLRWKNVPRLSSYVDNSGFPAISAVEHLDDDGAVGEAFMLGLRLLEGMKYDHVEALLKRGPRGQVRLAALKRHVTGGLLEKTGGHIRLTRNGVIQADTVLVDLL